MKKKPLEIERHEDADKDEINRVYVWGNKLHHAMLIQPEETTLAIQGAIQIYE